MKGWLSPRACCAQRAATSFEHQQLGEAERASRVPDFAGPLVTLGVRDRQLVAHPFVWQCNHEGRVRGGSLLAGDGVRETFNIIQCRAACLHAC